MKELTKFIKKCVTDKMINPKCVKPLVGHIKRVIKEGNSMSDETKQKISESLKGKPSQNKGRVWMYNTKVRESKLIPRGEVNQLLKDGWQKGRLEFTKTV
jgi:hypothetical protein